MPAHAKGGRSTLVWGTANPEGLKGSYSGVYLNTDDITSMVEQVRDANRSGNPIPVKLEHAGVSMGRVVSAWDSRGTLECVLEIDESVLEGSIGAEFLRTGVCKDLSLGYKVGLLSTVKIIVDADEFKATHTTPDSLTLNYYLDQMVQEGCEFCFMEVSSHGIHQKRTAALEFAGGVFTNLSHDHLDYHNTFAEYRDVKKAFFDQLSKTAFAITNGDDKNGSIMLQNTKAKKITYALKSYADYRAQILENQLSGLLLKINENEVWVKLIGSFNAYNLLAIFAVAVELGIEKVEALRLLSELESVSGRFQFVVSETKITAIVDYAHTPDALENVLQTIQDIRTKNEQLITVVGCGGDRDTTKRPIMAAIAAALSDKAIFTADNPRTEDPETIIQEMEKGVAPQNYKKTLSILDRKQAIKTACQLANTNDIILIAGKGHETYQEINGVRYDFDDLEIVTELLQQLNK